MLLGCCSQQCIQEQPVVPFLRCCCYPKSNRLMGYRSSLSMPINSISSEICGATLHTHSSITLIYKRWWFHPREDLWLWHSNHSYGHCLPNIPFASFIYNFAHLEVLVFERSHVFTRVYDTDVVLSWKANIPLCTLYSHSIESPGKHPSACFVFLQY